MNERMPIPFILSIAFGSMIAWIDTRPHWDDTGITAGLILISAMICGGLSPSRAWLWALIVGGIVFAANIILYGNYGSAIALGIALVGGYAGAGVRKGLSHNE
jgi:hypothetical protein